jgi:hypothetical protein
VRFGVKATAATDDVKTTFLVCALAQEASTFSVPLTAGSINCACSHVKEEQQQPPQPAVHLSDDDCN